MNQEEHMNKKEHVDGLTEETQEEFFANNKIKEGKQHPFENSIIKFCKTEGKYVGFTISNEAKHFTIMFEGECVDSIKNNCGVYSNSFDFIFKEYIEISVYDDFRTVFGFELIAYVFIDVAKYFTNKHITINIPNLRKEFKSLKINESAKCEEELGKWIDNLMGDPKKGVFTFKDHEDPKQEDKKEEPRVVEHGLPIEDKPTNEPKKAARNHKEPNPQIEQKPIEEKEQKNEDPKEEKKKNQQSSKSMSLRKKILIVLGSLLLIVVIVFLIWCLVFDYDLSSFLISKKEEITNQTNANQVKELKDNELKDNQTKIENTNNIV